MDNIPENILTVEYYDTYKKHYQEVAVTNQKLINGDEIFKLWAKNKMHDLKENSNDSQNKIIDISIKYQVSSPFTAFVCINENVECIQRELKIIKRINTRQSIPRHYSNSQTLFYGPSSINSYITSITSMNMPCRMTLTSFVGNSNQANSLKKNDYILINGHQCKIIYMTVSKVGKHGSAKAKITAIDVITGKKYEEIHPISHDISVTISDEAMPANIRESNSYGKSSMIDLDNLNKYKENQSSILMSTQNNQDPYIFIINKIRSEGY